MSNTPESDAAGAAPEVELNAYGHPKRSPCPQPTFTIDEYVAECGPCGPDTPHGALWRELVAAAAERAVKFPSTPRTPSSGGPMLMNPGSLLNEPRLSKKRASMDSAMLGKKMVVMLVVPEKRDAAVADVRRLIAGEKLADAAAWAFYEIGIFTLNTYGYEGWWHDETARDLALYRTASDHIIAEVTAAFATQPGN